MGQTRGGKTPPNQRSKHGRRNLERNCANRFLRITSCGNCWRFGNVGLRLIVIAHGKEDAFHIPFNVILRFIARNSK